MTKLQVDLFTEDEYRVIAARLGTKPLCQLDEDWFVGAAHRRVDARRTTHRAGYVNRPHPSCLRGYRTSVPQPKIELQGTALADKIGNRSVQCEKKDIDRYKRIVAVCRAGDEDLNAWMVSEGWAMSYRRYSPDYIRQEEDASRSKVGIWQGDFVAPWDWRRGKRLSVTQTQQPGSCLIKGNISRRGKRIYHVPGGQYYSRTKINQSKGERMFCTEAEAQAAGWRRSKR